jgi:hypothetical protein
MLQLRGAEARDGIAARVAQRANKRSRADDPKHVKAAQGIDRPDTCGPRAEVGKSRSGAASGPSGWIDVHKLEKCGTETQCPKKFYDYGPCDISHCTKFQSRDWLTVTFAGMFGLGQLRRSGNILCPTPIPERQISRLPAPKFVLQLRNLGSCSSWVSRLEQSREPASLVNLLELPHG